jgi:hypothetical protein
MNFQRSIERNCVVASSSHNIARVGAPGASPRHAVSGLDSAKVGSRRTRGLTLRTEAKAHKVFTRLRARQLLHPRRVPSVEIDIIAAVFAVCRRVHSASPSARSTDISTQTRPPGKRTSTRLSSHSQTRVIVPGKPLHSTRCPTLRWIRLRGLVRCWVATVFFPALGGRWGESSAMNYIVNSNELTGQAE